LTFDKSKLTTSNEGIDESLVFITSGLKGLKRLKNTKNVQKERDDGLTDISLLCADSNPYSGLQYAQKLLHITEPKFEEFKYFENLKKVKESNKDALFQLIIDERIKEFETVYAKLYDL